MIDPEIRKDDGCCYPQCKEIHLSREYSSNRVKLACFLHEIGHIYVDKITNKPLTSFECEFSSWWRAIQLHKKYFGRSFSKTQTQFMLKCLKSYC